MRILIIANSSKEHIRKFHIPFIEKMKQNGNIVDVAAMDDGKIPECDTQYSIHWKRSPISFKTFKGLREVKKILKNNKYDLIYCHTPIGGLAGRLCGKKYRKNGLKIVYFSHGFHFYKNGPKFSWIIFYPIEKFLSKYTDLLITLNTEDYELAKLKFKAKRTIKVNGVGFDYKKFVSQINGESNLSKKSMNIDENAKIIGYIAEINKNKNQIVILKTINSLLKKGLNIFGLLIGPVKDSKIYKYISKYHLEKRIVLTGWTNTPAKFLNLCDVYFATSKREGLGLNLLEAMSLNKNIVASSNRGHSEIAKYSSSILLVDTKNIDECAKAIEQQLNKATDNFKEYMTVFPIFDKEKCLIEVIDSINQLF